MQYKVYIYSNHFVDEICLPKYRTSFWLYRSVESGTQAFMEVKYIQNKWLLIENKTYKLKEKNNILDSGCLFTILSEEEVLYLYIEMNKHPKYHLYALESNVMIGRNHEHIISIQNPYISNNHAQIRQQEDGIYIYDMQSSNGVYVNNKRVKEKKLMLGDQIHIMGFHCIFVMNALLIRFQENIQCRLPYKNIPVLKEKIKMKAKEYVMVQYEDEKIIHKPSYELAPIVLEKQSHQYPLWYTLGPSITMGIATITSSGVQLLQVLQKTMSLQQAIPSFSMSCSMIAATLLWPIIHKKYEQKVLLQKRNQVMNEYEAYLMKMHEDILVEKQNLVSQYHRHIQKDVMLRQHWKDGIWSKSMTDLNLWIADYDSTLKFEIKIDKVAYEQFQDNQYMSALRNQQEEYTLPLFLNLKEIKCIGIFGQKANQLMHQYILQLCFSHTYKELKVFLIMEEAIVRSMNLYWLAHVKKENGRYVYTKESDIQRLFKDIYQSNCHILICFLHNKLEKLIPLHRLCSLDHVSLLYVNEDDFIPSFIKVKVFTDTSMLFRQKNKIPIMLKYLNQAYLYKLTLQLANIKDGSDHEKQIDELYLFDLFRCANKEQFNILDNWKHNHAYESLYAPIGIDEYGEIIGIDAHEKAHGPHGIIAGMTGSGKSEFLLTYMISLAIRYSYEEVVFLLIDYKGGMMASYLSKLPHVVGVMSNLNDSEMHRMIYALEKEIVFRQTLFSTTKDDLQESSMDIYTYQKLYIQQKVKKPLPHLFIVADEFAQLKDQQPEFLSFLKQVARIGRSLGIHLILATQKPAGVVDDEIWSNARFHVCLRVQDRQDSIEMLKKEDAVFLNKAGDFYLQVGHDELYIKAKCAWTQAKYIWMDVYKNNQRAQLSLYSYDGICLKKKKMSISKETSKTQLEAVIEQIQKEASGKAQSIVLKALPSPFYFHNSSYQYDKNTVCIGWIDDMKQQKQYPLYWKEEWKKVVIAGIQQKEKINLVRNVLTQLQECDKNVYVLFFYQGEQVINLYEFSIISKVINVYDVIEMERILHWVIHQTKYYVLLVFYEIDQHFYTSQGIQDLYEQVMQAESAYIQSIYVYRDVTQLSMRLLSSVHCFILFHLHDKSEYSMLLGEQPLYFPLQQEGSALFSNRKQINILQCYECDITISRQVNRRIPELVSSQHVILPMLKENSLYLGKATKRIFDIWLSYDRHILLLFKRKLPTSFLNILQYQLKHIYHIDETINESTLIDQHIFLWDFTKFWIQNHYNLYTHLWEDESKVHIMLIPFYIFEQLHLDETFIDIYEEGQIVWIGKGLSDLGYGIKCMHQPIMEDLTKKQGCVFTSKENIVFQLVEEKENG